MVWRPEFGLFVILFSTFTNKLKNLESLADNVVRAVERIPHGSEEAAFSVTEGRLK